MTNAMRWGASALLILGGVAVGSFVGCSSDDESPTPATEDTGGEEETSITDSGNDTFTPPADSGSGETSGDADAGPVPADRAVTLLFGAPDLGGRYACFGAFASDAVETSEPLQALGPIGIPTASGLPEDYLPIPYGAVIPLPLDNKAQAALENLTTVIYLTDTNPLKASPPTSCDKVWKTVRGDTKAWQKFAPKAVKTKEHALVSVFGCKNPASGASGECGAAAGPASLEFRVDKLDTTHPTTFLGATTGPKVGLQFVHFSPFPGSATPPVPSFQNVDVYVQLRKPETTGGGDAGDAGDDAAEAGGEAGVTWVADGAPIKIADGVKYKDLAAASVGVQVGDHGDEAYLLISPHGAPLCVPGSTGCAIIPIEMKPFLAGYKAAGGGFFDGQNQFLGLLGAPTPATLRLPMGNADSPK